MQKSSQINNFNVTRLSSGRDDLPWVVAVFAYNESRAIQRALKSIAASSGDNDIAIYVLVNGCTDSTAEKVRECAGSIKNLWLVESEVADKASTWNLFIHDLLPSVRVEKIDICFFMDGDVTLNVNSLPLLASALDRSPNAEACGAMPATGRDRDAWRQRMVANHMLAGNCYALRGSFVRHLRECQVRIPRGLIGEDFFVSWLVLSNVWRTELPNGSGIRSIFDSKAEFSFRSLSPWHWRDYKTYFRRRWRYTLRAIQHQMLILLINEDWQRLPEDVNELYRKAPLPSRGVWYGTVNTLLHLMALQWIRAQRKRLNVET